MTVLPNGVDIDRYSPGPSPIAYELGAERIFTYIGRIDPEKRVEAIIRAYLQAQAPSTTRLVIVGDGADLPRLMRRYRDERVVFTAAPHAMASLRRILPALTARGAVARADGGHGVWRRG